MSIEIFGRTYVRQVCNINSIESYCACAANNYLKTAESVGGVSYSAAEYFTLTSLAQLMLYTHLLSIFIIIIICVDLCTQCIRAFQVVWDLEGTLVQLEMQGLQE